jgi:phenylalanyl-tRNA synthetase beta chain
MKIVWSWIEELISRDGGDLPPPEEVAGRLTRAGLEVETIDRQGQGFSGVVVAEVTAKRPHPKSQKLTLVTLGDTEVVCGAPNVPEPGRKVLWARPGAKLPDGRVLAAKEVQGVVSPGMLCSGAELGIEGVGEPVVDGIIVLTAEEAEGVAVGADAADALGLKQTVLEIAIPANRPDALGHVGVAREIAALLGRKLVSPDVAVAPVGKAVPFEVEIADVDACPRFTARLVEGLAVKPSPLAVRARLRALGVRAISNLVDVTNYILFERGQPLHAYDFDKLRGGRLIVRRARAGETLTTLDGQERQLEAGDILICDAERPVGLGGVMGGLDTEVTASTTRVLLEAASFHPPSIRRTAKRLGLHSEASYRFERRVDPDGCERASQRAAVMLAELGGGVVRPGALDRYPTPPAEVTLTLRPGRVETLLGMPIPPAEIERHLTSLGLAVSGERVTVPSFRPDLEREVDLIEEIGRLHGYDDLPATLPASTSAPQPSGDPLAERLRDLLTAAGMDEAITFGFTSRQKLAALRLPAEHPVMRPLELSNPMREEQAVLRTSLLPNLLGAVAKNLAFGETDIRLFDVGAVFLPRPEPLPTEPRFVVGVLAGQRPDWLVPGGEVDFYDVKGIVERVLAALHVEAEFVAARNEDGFLHPGVAAAIRIRGEHAGVVGEVHPDTRAQLGIDRRCFAFEISLDRLGTPPAPQFQPLPRFPGITRDVSFFVDDFVAAARVRDAFLVDRSPLLIDLRILEDYREPGKVPEGKKGMLWTMTYRDPGRTLTDADVDAVHEKLVARALGELSAQRR